MSPDLAVVTSSFNPERYRTKLDNYRAFRAPLDAAGVPLWVTECSFDGRFELPQGSGVITVRGRDVTWQKERLLDLAIDTH